jgi:aminoglycoside phosphotransferase (APT) family kinase protein/predicted DNA-binding transcriptional regulator AlpA
MNETQTETVIMVSASGAASLTRGTIHCHNEGVGTDRADSDPPAEWWTTSDVAAYLGLRVSTVSSYRMRGQMPEPDMTLGRTHVWRPSKIIEWHQQRPRPGVGGRPVADSDLPADQKDDHVELTPARAKAILHKACAATGLDPDGARLLRIGSNAVYRLTAPVVARVSRYGASVDQAKRSVAVARWLESVNFPAVRTADVDQPVIVDGHVVTFWNAISDDGDQYASVREVAEVFAKLHALTAPDSLHLSPLDPFENAAHRIEVNDWLSPEDRTFLTDRLAELQTAYAGLEFVLPPGVIHGDASIGNVLRDRTGNPVVIDLDGFAIGPREWDVVLTAIYYDSFGWHTREEYETFARIYGFDIMRWPGYPVLREIREFLMVTWVIQKAGENERTAAEARKRIAALRSGGSRKDWQPY